jgi:hypothetical protein
MFLLDRLSQQFPTHYVEVLYPELTLLPLLSIIPGMATNYCHLFFLLILIIISAQLAEREKGNSML